MSARISAFGVCLAVLLLNALEYSSAQLDYVQSSRCSDTSCRSAPSYEKCEPKYDNRDGGCCPEWHCSSGKTFYGIRTKTNNVGGWKSNWKDSWSSLDTPTWSSWSSLGKGGQGNSLFDRDSVFQSKPKQDKLFDRYWRRR